MITSILIDGVEYISKVKLSGGVNYIERLDVELDSGTLVLPFMSISTPFQPFLEVKVTISGATLDYYILYDNIQIASANPLLYRHIIALIEPTKILEKYNCMSLAFTQPLESEFTPYTIKSYFERIRNNVPLQKTSLHSTTRIFDLSDEMNTLNNYELPETFLNKPTLREALDRGLFYVDGITRAYFGNSRLEVKADYFNRLNNTLTLLTNSTNIGKNLNGEYVYSEAESYLENAVTNHYNTSTPNGVLMTFRSDQVNINTDNMEVITRLPIDRIEKAVMQVKYSTLSETGIEVEIDITSLIYEKALWEALPLPESNEITSSTPRNQGNCVYYTRGQNKISGWGLSIDVLWGFATERLIIRLIKRAFLEQSIAWNTISTKTEDFKIRIEYYAQTNGILRMDKAGYDGIAQTQMTMNQAGTQIDQDLMAQQMTYTMKKVGNQEVTIDKRIKEWSERVQIGDYTSDGYIVTAIENNIFADYLLQKIELSKDYNKMSMYVGVNQEARQIPLPRNNFDVHLHYKEYAIISNTGSITNDSMIKDDFIRLIAEALKTNTGSDIKDYAVFFKSEKIGYWVFSEAEISKADTSFKISYGFNSNINAGRRMLLPGEAGNTTSRPLLKNVPYTDNYGRFDTFQFMFARFGSHATTPPTNHDQYATKLPYIDYSSDIDTAFPLLDSGQMKYTKDSSEILNMNYQIPIISQNASIVVGKQFWDIILGGTSNSLYTSTNEHYTERTNNKALGNYYGEVKDYFDITYDESKITISYKGNWVEISPTGEYDQTIEVYPPIGIYNTCPTEETMMESLGDVVNPTNGYVVKVIAYSISPLEVATICRAKYYQFVNVKDYKSVGFADSDGNLILGINDTQDGETFYINFKNKKE